MRQFLAALAFLPALALAAPDEAILGKAEGYPACRVGGGPAEQRCLVGFLSNYDTAWPARKVAKAEAPRSLKRLEQEPELGVDAFLASNRNTGLLVMRGDVILAERYQYDRKPTHRFQSYSMAKSVVAMLMGIAIADGKIASIDDKAEKYVPALKGHPYGGSSLRHLLTMSSGVSFTEKYSGDDDISVLGRRTIGQQGPGGVDSVLPFTTRARAPGTRFAYSSGETQVLGLVLREAIGRDLSGYLEEKLWKPMGAESEASWQIDAGGYETGYMGINATLRDWGRLGLLLADGGSRDGKSIIPSEWVKAATRAEGAHLRVGAASFNNGYGYQTWLIDNDGRFALFGVRGQSVFVDPATRTVVVHTAVHAQATGQERGPQFQFFYRTLKTLGSP